MKKRRSYSYARLNKISIKKTKDQQGRASIYETFELRVRNNQTHVPGITAHSGHANEHLQLSLLRPFTGNG